MSMGPILDAEIPVLQIGSWTQLIDQVMLCLRTKHSPIYQKVNLKSLSKKILTYSLQETYLGTTLTSRNTT